MEKLYSNASLIDVRIIQNMLDANNIVSEIRNEGLTSLVGEIPSTECWPDIWVAQDSNFDLATSLIKKFKESKTENKNWRCAQCSETIEASFDICWQCGSSR